MKNNSLNLSVKKKSIGIIVIGTIEVIVGLFGIYAFFHSLKVILGFYPIPDSVTNIQTFRERNSFMGLSGIIWSLPYVIMLPAGLGIFALKELARKISMNIAPFVLLFSLPYLSIIFSVVFEQKIFNYFGLSNGINSERPILRITFILLPWLILLGVAFIIDYFFRKFLSNSKVKEQFK